MHLWIFQIFIIHVQELFIDQKILLFIHVFHFFIIAFDGEGEDRGAEPFRSQRGGGEKKQPRKAGPGVDVVQKPSHEEQRDVGTDPLHHGDAAGAEDHVSIACSAVVGKNPELISDILSVHDHLHAEAASFFS